MASIVEKKALELADKLANEMGFFVVGTEYKKEDENKVLRVYLDKEGGIGINECEEFSRAYEKELDKEDFIEEAYILEVSSPGIDRILKTQREFLYYLNREVNIKLYKAIDQKKEFKATLKGYEDDVVTVVTDGTELKIPVKEAVYIRLYFEF